MYGRVHLPSGFPLGLAMGSPSKSLEGGRRGWGTIHQFLSGGLAWDQLCLSANVSASFKEALSFWGTSPFSPMG